MTEQHQTDSLEEQFRTQRQRAAAMRRRRGARRLFPLLLLMLLLTGLFLLLRSVLQSSTPEETTPPPSDGTATIAAVGDISLTEQMLRTFRSGDSYDFSPCFANVTAQTASADLTLGNLEGNITNSPGDHVYPPELLSALKDCGFDILQTANSYSIQNGITGLTRTKLAIEDAGMQALGTFSSREEREQTGGVLIREVNGIRFAFLALTKGLNNLRVPEGSEYSINLLYSDYDTNYSVIARSSILSLLDRAKAQNPDVIIAMVHWGSEYNAEITDSQKKIAELLFDNGADVILGSHSHLVGMMERRTVSSILGETEEGFAAYSLGDFLSSAEEKDAQIGCVLKLEFTKRNGRTTLSDVSYTPTYTAVPDAESEVTKYAVYDTLDAIHLYESGYYDRISKPLYETLLDTVDELKEQTKSDFQREAP